MAQEPVVDLYFNVVGTKVSADHGYLLYSALSHSLDQVTKGWLHDNNVALIPISGRYVGDGWLSLDRESRFGFRLPASQISQVLPLAGKSLQVGDATIRIGVTSVHPLIPAAALHARIVTTRNGSDEARFDAEVARQLQDLNIPGEIQRGRRRVLTIKDKKIAGHELLVTNLTADDSIRLQEEGLGGRRKMGCGVFVPDRLIS